MAGGMPITWAPTMTTVRLDRYRLSIWLPACPLSFGPLTGSRRERPGRSAATDPQEMALRQLRLWRNHTPSSSIMSLLYAANRPSPGDPSDPWQYRPGPVLILAVADSCLARPIETSNGNPHVPGRGEGEARCETVAGSPGGAREGPAYETVPTRGTSPAARPPQAAYQETRLRDAGALVTTKKIRFSQYSCVARRVQDLPHVLPQIGAERRPLPFPSLAIA